MGEALTRRPIISLFPNGSVQYADKRSIPAIVELHQEALGYSLNSQLGREHLAHLYQVTLHDPTSVVFKVEASSGLVGVVSATLDSGQLTARLRESLSPPQMMQLLITLARRPRLWPLVWATLEMNRPVDWNGQIVRASLTAIAVAPRARQHGIGRTLVAAVDRFMRSRGQSTYWLDTMRNNQTARAFYQRLGFVVCERRGPAMILVKIL